ncbi:MAG: hypothetical protein LBS15_01100 [Endomicrobium sp.]|nr:hypothetical protein [Endomicrobium sp.]
MTGLCVSKNVAFLAFVSALCSCGCNRYRDAMFCQLIVFSTPLVSFVDNISAENLDKVYGLCDIVS